MTTRGKERAREVPATPRWAVWMALLLGTLFLLLAAPLMSQV